MLNSEYKELKKQLEWVDNSIEDLLKERRNILMKLNGLVDTDLVRNMKFGNDRRVNNALVRAGYETLTQLMSMRTERDLLRIRNLGSRGRQQVYDKVHSLGLSFSWEMVSQ